MQPLCAMQIATLGANRDTDAPNDHHVPDRRAHLRTGLMGHRDLETFPIVDEIGPLHDDRPIGQATVRIEQIGWEETICVRDPQIRVSR